MFMKDMKRLRNCHRLEGTKETGELNATRGSGFDPGTKDMSGEIGLGL